MDEPVSYRYNTTATAIFPWAVAALGALYAIGGDGTGAVGDASVATAAVIVDWRNRKTTLSVTATYVQQHNLFSTRTTSCHNNSRWPADPREVS
jgi:hypothetical protein